MTGDRKIKDKRHEVETNKDQREKRTKGRNTIIKERKVFHQAN